MDIWTRLATRPGDQKPRELLVGAGRMSEASTCKAAPPLKLSHAALASLRSRFLVNNPH
ncbi:hypothetical protein [Sphingosinicella sp. BN140058]|uniref:hypothetical protein n=1 Tax=Sphingosinicella sp. BN140058 TaxID=1892855 RepID=UPI0013EDF1B5|nr:hypothetical protein [Sphingosinicella sp. BN140058]